MVSEILYFDGLAIGTGYDSLAQTVRGDSVVRTPPEPVQGAAGTVAEFSMRQIESHQELTEALDVSATVSLGNAISGGGSATASYSNNHSIDDYSVYLLCRVKVTKAQTRMRDVHLNKEAWDFLDQQGEEAFRKRYGDYFVVGISTGGTYYGLIQIHTTHAEDKQNIAADIKASGGLGQWSAAAAFKSAVDKISTNYTLDIYARQEGGTNLDAPVSVSDITTKAVAFAQTVVTGGDTAAVSFAVELLDYNALPLPDGKNPIDTANQADILRQLAEYRSTLYDMLGSVNYVLENQDQFIDPSIDDLNAQAHQLSADINEVYRAATACFRDYHACSLLTDMTIPKVTLPARKAAPAEPTVWVTVPDIVGSGEDITRCESDEGSWPQWKSDFGINSDRGVAVTGYAGASGRYYLQDRNPGDRVPKGSVLNLTFYADGNA
jgi:hypothetical protein